MNIHEVAEFIQDTIKCDVDVRNEFLSKFVSTQNREYIAQRIAATKVTNPRKPFVRNEPSEIEVQFEKKVLLSPATRMLGVLYDGFELQQVLNELIHEEENKLEHVHMIFTNRLVCTYSEVDYRYHYRTIICGYPTLICTSGIVEAPAKPREFYFMLYSYASMKKDNNIDEIKKKFEGRFIDYDDVRFTEVVKGIVLQGLFYYINGEPFCENKDCRLLNAHWQEDLINSQLHIGKLCHEHQEILEDFNRSR